ncbi:hypothetical protein OIU76_016074 [Salix suchowensis]|nr:hypothetical protein OIU76_016074 [Salix suchowensis]
MKGLGWLCFLEQEYGVKILLYRTPYLVDLVNNKAGRVLKLDSIRNDLSHGITSKKGKTLYKDMNRLIAFYKGLTTWARWVNRYVDPSRTKVFFQDISPTHYEGRDWMEPSKTCASETRPFFGASYPAGPPLEWVVVSKVLSRIKKPVYVLDVTLLSQYRKDAHPSHYSGNHGGNDCSHWCLPGLPDTWNQLLYAALFS